MTIFPTGGGYNAVSGVSRYKVCVYLAVFALCSTSSRIKPILLSDSSSTCCLVSSDKVSVLGLPADSTASAMMGVEPHSRYLGRLMVTMLPTTGPVWIPVDKRKTSVVRGRLYMRNAMHSEILKKTHLFEGSGPSYSVCSSRLLLGA